MGTTLIQAEYQSLIFEIRGYKVMIDTDLAVLYETETKVLKQQVKRNNDRFPKDFMFQLTKEEQLSEALKGNDGKLSEANARADAAEAKAEAMSS